MFCKEGDSEFDHDVTVAAATRPFQVMLDFAAGSFTPFRGSFVRLLSEMAGAFEDQEAVKRVLAGGDDPVIYRSYYPDVPSEPGHLAFVTTTILPGTVGTEFFMTKGHYHKRDSAELYLAMSGEGLMVMESREGDFVQQLLEPSALVYVPPGWAHRTVNTGTEQLTFMAAYFGDAGHDYASMEAMGGFAVRVHRGDEGPQLLPSSSRLDGEGLR
jgi:glucose-6-phosphate isomerase